MITCQKYHRKAKREDKLEWMAFESRIDLSSDLEQGNSEAKYAEEKRGYFRDT